MALLQQGSINTHETGFSLRYLLCREKPFSVADDHQAGGLPVKRGTASFGELEKSRPKSMRIGGRT
ncbi:MAG TPA: hypothetical protein DDZ66_11990 [Firmicutes bacterium]|nr:hypothetical protein [Bacillota bacterium]